MPKKKYSEQPNYSVAHQSKKVRRARDWAAILHRDQRYGALPYTTHLADVERILIDSGFDTDVGLRAAAWLHDVIEDCGVDPVTILDLFGQDVHDLVLAVTDGPGENRKERKKNTYPKVRSAGARATALKLADRIANVESSKRTRSSLFRMYEKEHLEFWEALYTVQHGLDYLWRRLQLNFGERPVESQS